MSHLPLPLLCLVTDRAVAGGVPLGEVVERAVAGGVNMVQLREKDLPAGELLRLAEGLRRITLGRALLMVNDRVDVAMACEADGVQLGEEALPVEVARRLVGRGLLIGRSVHSRAGALRAQDEGADLLVLGTIFQTPSHPGAVPGGLGLVSETTSAVDIPVLAIGGITRDNTAAVMEVGASGVAVMREVLAAPDPEAAARELMEVIQRSWLARKQPVRS